VIDVIAQKDVGSPIVLLEAFDENAASSAPWNARLDLDVEDFALPFYTTKSSVSSDIEGDSAVSCLSRLQ